MPPLVTVGMPVRNGARFLPRALESLCAQTYPNVEILVSDNASTDGTAGILEAFAARHPRLQVRRRRETLGIADNFVSVLEDARGAYFMWAADDDVWMPGFVEALVAELEAHPDAGAAMSAVTLVTEDGEPLQTVRFSGRYDPNASGRLRMLRAATSFQKLNFYLYGLHRTALLREAMRSFVDVPGWDRLFVCQLVLGTRLRQVDRVLHHRTVHHRPTHERLPEERFNALKRDPWVDVTVIRALCASVLRSAIVPSRRKVLLPYVVWRYARLLLIVRAGAFAKRHLPGPLWKRLRARAAGGPVEHS